jgi:uncharacterized membrane protein YbhN (UPF0104 family)
VRSDRVTWLSGAGARIALGVVMSALCLWLALRQAPLDELLAAAHEVNVWWIGPAVVGNVLSLGTRAPLLSISGHKPSAHSSRTSSHYVLARRAAS